MVDNRCDPWDGKSDKSFSIFVFNLRPTIAEIRQPDFCLRSQGFLTQISHTVSPQKKGVLPPGPGQILFTSRWDLAATPKGRACMPNFPPSVPSAAGNLAKAIHPLLPPQNRMATAQFQVCAVDSKAKSVCVCLILITQRGLGFKP